MCNRTIICLFICLHFTQYQYLSLRKAMISSVLYVCTNDNLKQIFVFFWCELRKHCTNMIISYKTLHNWMCLIKFNFTILKICFFVNILTFHYNSYLDQSSLFQRKMGASHLREEHKEEVNITPKTENFLPDKFHD